MNLSTAQACAKLGGISRWTLMNLIKAGEIQATKGRAKNSRIHIPEESVNAYLVRNSLAGRPQDAGAA